MMTNLTSGPDPSYDIVVVGAGSAGATAAIAAARTGSARVLVIERYGFLGGTSTQSLDTFYGFFTPGEAPLKVAGGIADEVVDRLDRHGDIFLRPNTYGAGTGVTYNPEYLKIVWDDLVSESGAEVLLHAQLVGIDGDASDGHLLRVLTPGGLIAIRARRVIDASGDAHAAHFLGAPLEQAGSNEAAQTFTTTFRMCNVDLAEYESAGGKKMLQAKMAAAVDSGAYPLPRRAGSIHPMVQPNCIATVAVRVPFVSPFDPRALSQAEREGRRQVFIYEEFLRAEVPGFAAAKIIGMSSPQIGIRESRRLYGTYRLNREDCLGRARFSDAILLCGAPVEDHRLNQDGEEETEWTYIPDNGAYQVPYRCLTAPGFETLWVAGRCFSATHLAHASCRSMAQTMSLGQAAGIAAALSIADDCAASQVSVTTLQDRLVALGAVLTEPKKVARTGPRDWATNRPD